MPSTNKTPNLGLSQFVNNSAVDSDQLTAADYNADMLAIDVASGWGEEKTASLQSGWIGTLKYRKHNGTGIVAVYGNVTSPSTTPGTRQVITTLDNGWRPPTNIAIPTYENTVGRVQLAMKLTTSGSLTCEYETASGAQNINASTTYYINTMYLTI